MNNKIKTLGDQLRNVITQPIAEPLVIEEKPTIAVTISLSKPTNEIIEKSPSLTDAIATNPPKDILSSIRDFAYAMDTHPGKLRVRLDENTIRMLNQFKLATGVDMNKTIAFALDRMFNECPELKTIIKQSLENFKLWAWFPLSWFY